MEISKSILLNNFGVISMIMPYFGPTHECFLMLSTLSNASRNKLDEFYSEFRKIMLRYSKEILIYEENLDQLFLPTDLYRFSISINQQEELNKFTEFVTFIAEKKGHYFNDKFMSSQLGIQRVLVDIQLTDQLYLHLESLSAIQTIKYGDTYPSEINFENSTLVEQVVFYEGYRPK